MEGSGKYGRREGFLALPRGVLSQGPDAWFPGEWGVACTYAALVTYANYADAASPLPRQKITLKIGQLIIGQDDWAKRHSMTRQNLRTLLHRLTFLQKINQQPNQFGTIITIIDYAELFLYWPDDQPAIQPAANQLLTSCQPHHDKGDKKDTEIPPLIPPSGGSRVERTASLWLPAGRTTAARPADTDRLRRRRARDQAKRWVDRAIGAANRTLPLLQEDDRHPDVAEALGAIERSISSTLGNAWPVLMDKFVTWRGFCSAYWASTNATSYGTTKVHSFEAQLRETFALSVLESAKLTVIQGGQ